MAAAPNAAAADDLMMQFSVPNAPASGSLPQMPAQPAAPTVPETDDILAQFSTNPNSPMDTLANSLFGGTAAGMPTVSGETVGTGASKFAETSEIVEVTPVPAPNDYDPFQKKSESVSDALDDLLLMPSAGQPSAAEPLPDIATVPSAPTQQTASPVLPQQPVPTLNVPTAPPAAPIPLMPVPPTAAPVMPEPLPGYNTPQAAPYAQIPAPQAAPAGVPVMQGYPYQQQQPAPAVNLFTAPVPVKPQEPGTKPPQFVGYSADGRMLYQNYDAVGNPIPINEPVYSAPPEQPKNPIATNALAANLQGGAPVMDMDELMASMGIPDPKKPKKEEGKAINYTEYHIPDKKKKQSKPKSAPTKPHEQTGPISAAEARRRKKVDKINKDFEKQLLARGIDPKTGGIIIDPRK